MSNIDRQRGASIRFHPAGFRVAMYKDDPGKYIDERGEPVTAKVAEQAGFEVKDFARERAKKEALAALARKVEEDFASQEQDVENLLNADSEGLTVKAVAKGKYAIMDGDNRLTRRDMTKKAAESLLADMQARSEEE